MGLPVDYCGRYSARNCRSSGRSTIDIPLLVSLPAKVRAKLRFDVPDDLRVGELDGAADSEAVLGTVERAAPVRVASPPFGRSCPQRHQWNREDRFQLGGNSNW
jgi:hypothetical protein